MREGLTEIVSVKLHRSRSISSQTKDKLCQPRCAPGRSKRCSPDKLAEWLEENPQNARQSSRRPSTPAAAREAAKKAARRRAAKSGDGRGVAARASSPTARSAIRPRVELFLSRATPPAAPRKQGRDGHFQGDPASARGKILNTGTRAFDRMISSRRSAR
jgi:DNA gyrase subunit B